MEKIIERILDYIKIPSVSSDQKNIRCMVDRIKQDYKRPGIFIREFNFENAAPVLLLSNYDGLDFDVMTLGHLDVVPAKDELFVPQIRDGRIYARGSVDMKSQIVINLSCLEYVVDHKLRIRFGVLITMDEETSSNGIRRLSENENIMAKIVMDNDSGNLNTLIEKYKHPICVKVCASGVAAHSSTPWKGCNAVNALSATIEKLKGHFPQYAQNGAQPENIWVDTMVVTGISSPMTYNVIPAVAEALLNFRLTEKTSLEQLKQILTQSMAVGCTYEVIMSSGGVYMDAENPIIKYYRKVAGEVLGREPDISQSCGATDSRPFADKSVIIMHSLNGADLHGDNEYVEIDSIFKLAQIQQKFVEDYVAGLVPQAN